MGRFPEGVPADRAMPSDIPGSSRHYHEQGARDVSSEKVRGEVACRACSMVHRQVTTRLA